MFKTHGLLFMYAETHVHPGAGEGLGHIDQAIQRDRATDLPIIQSSSTKGSLKDHLDGDEMANIVFGTGGHAGSASFVDARTLLLPVRSLSGMFAWVTCPAAIALLERDYTLAARQLHAPKALIDAARIRVEDSEAVVANDQVSVVIKGASGSAILDDFHFVVRSKAPVGALAKWLCDYAVPSESGEYWRARLYTANAGAVNSALVLVSDDVFCDFARYAIEVVERNQIDDETGTSRNLWTEEHLPAHSMLYAPVLFTDGHGRLPDGQQPMASDCATWLKKKVEESPLMQLGAGETLGRGLIRLRWVEPGTSSEGAAKSGSEPSSTSASSSSPPDSALAARRRAAARASAPIYRMREQARAKFVADAVQRDVLNKEMADEYCSLVRQAPAMLRNAGLPAMLAFLLDRGCDSGRPSTTKPHGVLYLQLQKWLSDVRLSARPIYHHADSVEPHLFDAMRNGTSEQLRHATNEVEALLVWHKRLGTAMLKKPDKPKREDIPSVA